MFEENGHMTDSETESRSPTDKEKRGRILPFDKSPGLYNASLWKGKGTKAFSPW